MVRRHVTDSQGMERLQVRLHGLGSENATALAARRAERYLVAISDFLMLSFLSYPIASRALRPACVGAECLGPRFLSASQIEGLV